MAFPAGTLPPSSKAYLMALLLRSSLVSCAFRAFVLASAVLGLGAGVAHGQATATPVSLGNVSVGATATGTVTFNFTGTTAISSISVTTQGATGLDFTASSPNNNTCIASTYSVGTSCTFAVGFAPTAVGVRYGAVSLVDGSGNILASAVVTGVGIGALPAFPVGTASVLATSGFSNPQEISVDSAGNVYVPNLNNHTVSKVTPSGTVSTFFTLSTAGFFGTAVDGAGNVYMSDRMGGHVYKANAAGTLVATWPVSGTSLSQPDGMAFDTNGNLYVADQGTNKVVVITPAGVASTLTVSGYSYSPFGVAVDNANTVYIADASNSRVLEVTAAGTASVLTITSGPAPSYPNAIAVDAAHNVYVMANSGYLHITPAGVSTNVVPSGPTFANPSGLAIDNKGLLYANVYTNTLFKINTLAASFSTASPAATGTTSSEFTATLENDGNAAANFTAITAAGPAVKGPSTTCATATPYAPDATCVVGIEFTPTTHGASPQTGTVTLSGTGFTPAVESVSGNVTGDPTQLVYSPVPTTPITAGGNGGTITVTLEDSTGAVAVNDTTAPVTLTVTGPGSYTHTYGPVNAVNSVATFNTSANALTKSGSYTYTATSSGLTSAVASETVTPGASASLTIAPQFTFAVPGGGDNFTITAYDVYGNVASASTDNVSLTSTDPSATDGTALPVSVTLAAGTVTTPIKFMTVGNQTVTATDTTNATIPAVTSASVTVTNTVPAFTVTSSADDGTGTCTDQTLTGATLDANCQLRTAVAAVNSAGITGLTAPQPTITFAPSVYGQTFGDSYAGAFQFSANFALVGPGPAQSITLSGGGARGIFKQSGASTQSTISGVTLTQGNGVNNPFYGGSAWYSTAGGKITFTNVNFTANVMNFAGNLSGGAIYATGAPTMVLAGCTFTGNKLISTTSAAYGGAIYQSGGTLSITNSAAVNTVFSGNVAQGATAVYGGALYLNSVSPFTINGVTFSANQISNSSTNPIGGGVLYENGASTGSIVNSLFSGNTATGNGTAYGGALDLTLGTITITGSTFTGNLITTVSGSASNNHFGGAIYNGGTTTFYNDTITGNTVTNATNAASGSYRYGGVYSSSAIAAYNTVISGNTAIGSYKDELNVSPTSSDYIDASTTTACGGNCTPLLSTLGNYGGPTQTMLPLPGSPLLAGNAACSNLNTTATTTDARGNAQSTKYAGTTHCDIGATQANYTLAFAQQPTNTARGATITPSPSVQLYETGVPVALNLLPTSGTLSAGQTTAGYTGTGIGGTINIAASAGTLSGSTTATTSSSPTVNPGLATFPGLSIATDQAGDTLLATITNGTTTLGNATSALFNITDAPTLTFGKAPPPQVVTGGNAGTVTVNELTAAGALSTTDNSTVVTLTVSATGYTTATYMATVSGGVATFNLSADALTPAGTYTYTATAPGDTSVTATETVAASTSSMFSVTGAPLNEGYGTTSTITVRKLLADGMTTDTSFTGAVFLSSSDPRAVFTPQNYTYNASDNGSHTFMVTLYTGGVQSITATDNLGDTGAETNISVDFIWVVNSAGLTTRLNELGAAVVSGAGITGATSTAGGVAFDAAGSVWSVTNANNTLNFVTNVGANAATFSGGGLNAPVSLMVDGKGSVWVANAGNNSVSVFSNSGVALSPATGLGSGGGLNAPGALLIDSSGGVWVTNSNSVTHIFGVAAPVTTLLVNAVTGATLGTQP